MQYFFELFSLNPLGKTSIMFLMNCWKCRADLDDPPTKNLPFRAICDHCNSWLHCCRNCKHYKPGLPNNCKIPGTEQIADREGCNFCDDYTLLEKPTESPNNSNTAFNQLFDETEEVKPKNFNDLFDD